MSGKQTFFDFSMGPKNFSVSPSCHWIDVFNNEERRLYHAGFLWACVVSFLAMTWLNITLTKTSLWMDDSYRYLILFTLPAGIRRFLLALSSFFNQTIMSSCVFFAYVDSFFGMVEIEGLTHACISRFVMARYAAKGWQTNRRHWQYFMYSTIAFALFYTFVPLTCGYGGSYHYDFTCTTCSYNMILPDTRERYFIVFLYFMRYVKPTLMMFVMVVWAYYLEKYICRDKGNAARKKLTWMMLEVLGTCAECCGLLAAIRFLVILNQLFNLDYEDIVPSFANGEIWIEWSFWLHAIWPICALYIMAWRDENIRCNMFHLLFKLAEKEEDVKAAADAQEKKD